MTQVVVLNILQVPCAMSISVGPLRMAKQTLQPCRLQIATVTIVVARSTFIFVSSNVPKHADTSKELYIIVIASATAIIFASHPDRGINMSCDVGGVKLIMTTGITRLS